jgi:uncharacterized protein YuzE
MEENLMEALKLLEKKPKLHLDYDEDGDVLYIAFGGPKPAIGVDVGEGVIVRYDEKRKEVIGLTIIGVGSKMARYLKETTATKDNKGH